MMRKLVERHRGILPLDTVESIWRVIIATFTHVQAPYSVHADLTVGEAAMRDSARFHFGFTVPLVPHLSAAGAIAAVAASKGDLALVPAASVAGSGAWWASLEGDKAPKIIARLPFVERPDHPGLAAGLCGLASGRRRGRGRSRGPEPSGVGLGRRRRAHARSARRSDRRTGRRLRRRGLADFGAAGVRRSPRSPRPWSRPVPRCARRPSSAATRPAIRSPTTRLLTRQSMTGGTEMTALTASATAPRRARHRGLCAGQELGARRRQDFQAVVEREPARREPEGDRGLSVGRRMNCRIIRTAPRPPCARRSARPMASIPTASSAAPAPTT